MPPSSHQQRDERGVGDAEAAGRLRSNLLRLEERVAAAALGAGRDPSQVQLLGVTKYAGPELIRLLHRAGLRNFGESTVQRGEANRLALSDLADARWHLIGHLQRNKAARALRTFASIHSVDSERLLRSLALHVQEGGLPLPELYVEVNIACEPKKSGLLPADLRAVLGAARAAGIAARAAAPGSGPGLAGLMGMAPQGPDAEAARPHFRRLRELRDACVEEGLLAPGAGLSMGMSADFAVAVEEGATVVRVGSLLFDGLPPCTLSP